MPFAMACKGFGTKGEKKSRDTKNLGAFGCVSTEETSEAGTADLVGAVGGLNTSELDSISTKYSSSSENLTKSSSTAVDKHTLKRKARTLTFRRKKCDKIKESCNKQGRFWTLKKRLPVRLRQGKDHGLPEPTIQADPGTCVCTGYRRTEDHVLGPGIVFAPVNGSSCKVNGASASPLQAPSVRTNRIAMGAGPGPTGMNTVTNFQWLQQLVPAPHNHRPTLIDLSRFNAEEFPTEDVDEMLIAQRAQDMEMGVEVSPSHVAYPQLKYSSSTSSSSTSSSSGSSTTSHDQLWGLTSSFQSQCVLTTTYPLHENQPGPSREAQVNELRNHGISRSFIPRTVHTQVDYIHCLVPDLLPITICTFYWGVMDRYEAEKLLENRPEGTFLLRDSAQEEFLFSVSFRRYGRSLHARIEQWNHRFSFDSHDPGVFASDSVCGLIEHYKDPSCCMFFEPMLTMPLNRTFPFSLQHQCRATICNHMAYDGVNYLPLPKPLKEYLKYYHYKQKVRVRRFEVNS